MASPYSITIQVAYPSLQNGEVGHVAISVNGPNGSLYAGFGPDRGSPYLGQVYAGGQFNVEFVPSGSNPTVGTAQNPNWSNVFNDSTYATFTVPVSVSQATDALREISGSG